jgi:hypothetical protein
VVVEGCVGVAVGVAVIATVGVAVGVSVGDGHSGTGVGPHATSSSKTNITSIIVPIVRTNDLKNVSFF